MGKTDYAWKRKQQITLLSLPPCPSTEKTERGQGQEGKSKAQRFYFPDTKFKYLKIS